MDSGMTDPSLLLFLMYGWPLYLGK
jgi:hypothetical protein